MVEQKKNLSTEPYKGVRDFYPEDMAVQNYIFSVWRSVCEKSGYSEYGASILEPAELYRSKGSEEIVNGQMFTFKDRGDREVALRPEMTPTLARMIAAKRRSWKFPLRWFSMPNVFRYEQPQRGRKREHWQLNADLMGEKDTIKAEVEIVSLAHAIMTGFGTDEKDFSIRINSRTALGAVDKATLLEWDKKGKPEGITISITPAIENLLAGLKALGVTNAVFDPNIVRGFDYYTGMVFEVFDTHADNKRSLFGGGRYDNLLELFGVEPVPTVGFGMGDVTIRDFLETHKLPLSTKR